MNMYNMIARLLLLIRFFTTVKPLCTNLATETTLNAICSHNQNPSATVLYSSLRINEKQALSIQTHKIAFMKYGLINS